MKQKLNSSPLKITLMLACSFILNTVLYAAINCPNAQTCFSLKAVDGSNSGRFVSDGGTLSMVVADSGRRYAMITATADSAAGTFGDNEPSWSGQTAGNDGNATVGYGSYSIINKTITATAGGVSKNVEINLVGKQANTVPIGSFKSDSTMHNMKEKLKFPGGASFTVAWALGNTSYNSEQVDKWG